jgi:uncharacterized protein YlzI (FlbEa/FlbD family)
MTIIIQDKSWMFINAKHIESMTIDARCPELEISMASGRKIHIKKRCKKLINPFIRRGSRHYVNWLWSSIIQLNHLIDNYEKK